VEKPLEGWVMEMVGEKAADSAVLNTNKTEIVWLANLNSKKYVMGM